MLRGGFVGAPMTPHAVREIVRSRCELAGLHVDDFSAHSLRSGVLTEAGRRGVPLPDGHPKLLHSWPVKLLQAGRGDYEGSDGMARREAASLRR